MFKVFTSFIVLWGLQGTPVAGVMDSESHQVGVSTFDEIVESAPNDLIESIFNFIPTNGSKNDFYINGPEIQAVITCFDALKGRSNRRKLALNDFKFIAREGRPMIEIIMAQSYRIRKSENKFEKSELDSYLESPMPIVYCKYDLKNDEISKLLWTKFSE